MKKSKSTNRKLQKERTKESDIKIYATKCTSNSKHEGLSDDLIHCKECGAVLDFSLTGYCPQEHFTQLAELAREKEKARKARNASKWANRKKELDKAN